MFTVSVRVPALTSAGGIETTTSYLVYSEAEDKVNVAFCPDLKSATLFASKEAAKAAARAVKALLTPGANVIKLEGDE